MSKIIIVLVQYQYQNLIITYLSIRLRILIISSILTNSKKGAVMEENTIQQFDAEELQQLLAGNPQLLPFLIQLNKKKEEIELLDFIDREQQIIKEQLVHQSIPALIANIQQLSRQLIQADMKIQELQFHIDKEKRQVQEYRKATQKQYMDSQGTTAQMRKIINDMGKEKFSSMQFVEPKIAIFNAYNKQNHDWNRKKKIINQETEAKRGSSVEITKLIQLRAENKAIQLKIGHLTEEVRMKIDEVEKKRKEINKSENKQKETKFEKRKSKIKNNKQITKCIQIRKSIIGSQLISVESYLESE